MTGLALMTVLLFATLVAVVILIVTALRNRRY